MTRSFPPLVSVVYDRFIGEVAPSMTAALRAQLRDELPTAATVVDIGCGGGQLALALADELPSAKIIGIDLSDKQIELATRRAAGNDRLRFEVGSAESLPLPDSTAEAAISVGSIKHWPHPAQGLSEMIRILRPGGALFVLELDRGLTWHDARNVAENFQHVGPLRAPAAAFFRILASVSFPDPQWAEKLTDDLQLDWVRVGQIPGIGARQISGHKPHQSE